MKGQIGGMVGLLGEVDTVSLLISWPFNVGLPGGLHCWDRVLKGVRVWRVLGGLRRSCVFIIAAGLIGFHSLWVRQPY